MSRRTGKNEFFSGLSFTLLFGILFFAVHGFFWIFPLIFVGILPLIRGTERLLDERGRNEVAPRRKQRPPTKEERERSILKCAQKHNGVVTPTLIAVETDMAIAQAEETLEDLVRRGYASLEVRENGSLEYRFPDLV